MIKFAFVLVGIDFIFAGLCLLLHLGSFPTLPGWASQVFSVYGLAAFIGIKFLLLCAISHGAGPGGLALILQWPYRLLTVALAVFGLLGWLTPVGFYAAVAGLSAYLFFFYTKPR